MILLGELFRRLRRRNPKGRVDAPSKPKGLITLIERIQNSQVPRELDVRTRHFFLTTARSLAGSGTCARPRRPTR